MNLIDENFNENTSLNDNQYGYKMERKDSIDIDTMEDWKQAEQALGVRRIQDVKGEIRTKLKCIIIRKTRR